MQPGWPAKLLRLHTFPNNSNRPSPHQSDRLSPPPKTLLRWRTSTMKLVHLSIHKCHPAMHATAIKIWSWIWRETSVSLTQLFKGLFPGVTLLPTTTKDLGRKGSPALVIWGHTILGRSTLSLFLLFPFSPSLSGWIIKTSPPSPSPASDIVIRQVAPEWSTSHKCIYWSGLFCWHGASVCAPT